MLNKSVVKKASYNIICDTTEIHCATHVILIYLF